MRWTCFILFVFSFHILQAQSVQPSIDQLLKSPMLKNASTSIHVQDASTGEVLGKYDEEKSLIPASSLKLITTGVALEKLGKNFRYHTKLLADANNIYLVGSGDPTLGAPKSDYTISTKQLIDKMAKAIADSGSTQFNGGVLAIADVFDTAPVGESWPWYDLGNYYAGGVWGLNIRENYYDLFLDQNSTPGKAPQCCGTDPEITGLRFINELISGPSNSGDNAYIYGAPYGYQKFIRGSIPAGSGTFKIKGSIPEPPLLAAQLLHQAAIAKDIQITQAPAYTFTAPSLAQSQELMSHASPSLLDIITETNRKSINLYAEALLKTIALKGKGKPGSYENGIDLVYDHLKSSGINTDGLYLVDGSGMSPRNGISSKHFTNYLTAIYQKKEIYQDFKSSLAIIGRQGTLQYMMKQEPIAGHLYGKSGSMDRVRSYTGYIETQSGRTVSFSIIVNNFSGKSRPLVKQIEKLFANIYAL